MCVSIQSFTSSNLANYIDRHQKQALTFMLRREEGWAVNGSCKDIWRKDDYENGETR